MTHLTVPAMVTALLLSHNALAEEFGTFEEARELLNRATAAVKADKQQAFEKFNRNDPRYRDRSSLSLWNDAQRRL